MSYISAVFYYALRPWKLIRTWRLVHNSSVVEEPFIFVMGPPRSGTTLLHSLLLGHNSVSGFPNETAAFSYRSIDQYDRFQNFLDKEVHRIAAAQSNSLAEFAYNIHRFSLGDERKVYCEKTPQHAIWLPYILAKFPNCKIVFCVRDPRDAYCSAVQSDFIPQSSSIKRHAKYFKRCVAPYINEISSDKRCKIFLCKYETLTRDPKRLLSNMLSFLEIDGSAEELLTSDFRQGDPRAQMSQFESLNDIITDRSVGRWRSQMDPSSNRKYLSICTYEMKVFGYLGKLENED